MTDKLGSYISEIATESWDKTAIFELSKSIKEPLKSIKIVYKTALLKEEKTPLEDSIYHQFYMIEKVSKQLIKTRNSLKISTYQGTPVLGKVAYFMSNSLSIKSLADAIENLKAYKYISNTDISTIDWQLKYYAITMLSECLEKGDLEGVQVSISCLFTWNNINFDELHTLVNPLEEIYQTDPYYAKMAQESRQLYRDKTSKIAQAIDLEELRIAKEYLSQANKAKSPSKSHIGHYIYTDYDRVFLRPTLKVYRRALWLVPLCLSLIITILAESSWFWALLYFPIYAITKIIIDETVLRNVVKRGIEPLPRMDLNNNIGENEKTLAVISSLITSEKDLLKLEKTIEELHYTNPSEHLYYCLLCDLKASNVERDENDSAIINYAEKLAKRLNESFDNKAIIIIRKRQYSKTQREFTGWERKRGAIHQLILEIAGENQDFQSVFGDMSIIKDTKFIAALDTDTKVLMDTITELVSIAVHPLNQPVIKDNKVIKGYGIICPRISSQLTTSLKTPFAKLMGGVGGTTTYEDFSADLYQNTFDEGIFTGKGLLDVKCYLSCCTDRFKDETVLSHDILEGGYMRTAYASDIAFSDGFPQTTISFFKRLERWMRGDVQNIPFIRKKSGLSSLDRLKLWDNVRRPITNFMLFALFLVGAFIAKGYILGIVGIVALIAPYFAGLLPNLFNLRLFSFSRKFYSGIRPRVVELSLQCCLNFLLVPKTALTSLKAFWLGIWRRFISKKNLLQWTTAAQTDAHKSTPTVTAKSFILPDILCLALVVSGNPLFIIIGVLFLAALPVMIYCNNPYPTSYDFVDDKSAAMLKNEVRKMWRFYDDYVTSAENFLPPDNVQYSPIYAIAHRTSPTNMGLYLVSALTARDFSMIDSGELYFRVSTCLKTVEKLDTWHGNLFNWYDTQSLSTLNRIVSSVDSGNFLCSMVVLSEGLKDYVVEDKRFEKLIARIDDIIEKADLSPFYDKSKGLLSIAYDESSDTFANNHYDLLMSEARMTSYYAIAMGQVPKKHWKKLSHAMSRLGRYAGPLSWTGTMFEYFMPELYLKCSEGSLGYEALKYAVHCQKHRALAAKTPFGYSESGFYAFDTQLNYQYKAHGVGNLGLQRDLDKNIVVSPYSSFLILSYDYSSAVNNLARIEKLGASHPLYGFYEAVDFTPDRVGRKGYEIVKSHMAHHVGMSIISVANLLLDGVHQRRFLQNKRMNRASELLEQKVIAGEIMLDNEQKKQPPVKLNTTGSSSEDFSEITPTNPRVNLLSNGYYTGVYTDVGASYGLYQGKLSVAKTTDFLRRPVGQFYAITELGKALPFSHLPISTENHFADEQSVTFTDTSTEYYANGLDLRAGMKVTLHEGMPCEYRKFVVKNAVNFRRNLVLNAYFEPIIASYNDYTAHPAFVNLFLKQRFDSDEKVFVIHRKDRHSNKKTYMAVGFVEDVELSYILSKEVALERNEGISSFINNSQSTENHNASLPCPCLLIKAEMSLEPSKQREITMFTTFALSEDELYHQIKAIRENAKPDRSPLSIFSHDSLEGRIALKLLPAVIFSQIKDQTILEAVEANTLNAKELWRLGVSGDFPIVFANERQSKQDLIPYIKAQHAMRVAQIHFDFVILCSSENQFSSLVEEIKSLGLGDMLGKNTGIFLLKKSDISSFDETLLKASSVYLTNSATNDQHGAYQPIKVDSAVPLPRETSGIPVKYGEFHERGFTVTQKPPAPYCNIIANPVFGTLVSESSLGFTWAINSRENKLTPWHNDITNDNNGELLILKYDQKYYDIVKGSTANFIPNGSEYSGLAGVVKSQVTVCVSTEGYGKIVEVALENISEKEIIADLAYYVEPVLGVNREKAWQQKPNLNGKILEIENNTNLVIDGKMAILGASQGQSTTKTYLTNKTDFWQGKWDKTMVTPNDSPCAVVIIKRDLPPKECVKFRFILSFANSNVDISKEVLNLTPVLGIKYENKLKINTPDKLLDNLFNTWLPWQVVGGRLWARTGFYQNGGAFGFRDQLQDSMAAAYFMPHLTKQQILRACNAQFKEGDVLHWWHDLPREKKGVRTRYSDDLLWLPYVIADYIEKTSDYSLLDTEVYFIEGEALGNRHEMYQQVFNSDEKASVYEHGKRAIKKGLQFGSHGLVLMGCGDWNDGYNGVGIGGKGESVWLTQFVIMVLEAYQIVAIKMNDSAFLHDAINTCRKLRSAIEESCWDGEHYLRAFYDDGSKMGSDENDECQVDILPQAFATLANLSDNERKEIALKTAMARLVDEKNMLIKLFTPPFTGKGVQKPGYVASYPIGVRENGGQYTHGVLWFILAMLKSGKTDEGLKLLQMLNPASHASGDIADIYKSEPYFLCGDVYSNPNANGRAGWSIYTGAAAWYYKCVLEGLLGITISEDKLKIKPQIPSSWDSFSVEVTLRNTQININVNRDNKLGIWDNDKKITDIILDGEIHNVKIGI